MVSMSMYGAVFRTDQVMPVSLTIDSCDFNHSLTRPLAVWCST